jgi:Family of unknown function (DUF5995)
VIEAIGSGSVGRGAGPARPQAGEMLEAVARLQPGADARARGHGAGPVGRLLTVLADADVGGMDRVSEFRSALLVELARRYLRAVRGHARDAAVPRVWQVLLDRWEGGADPARTAVAGAHALAGHDLALAVVSTCTVLGRTPGRIERVVVQAMVDRLAILAEAAVGADAGARDIARGLALLCARGEGWRQAEHLWGVRGRPSEAEKERAALDWRAALVAEALLGG